MNLIAIIFGLAGLGVGVWLVLWGFGKFRTAI